MRALHHSRHLPAAARYKRPNTRTVAAWMLLVTLTMVGVIGMLTMVVRTFDALPSPAIHAVHVQTTAAASAGASTGSTAPGAGPAAYPTTFAHDPRPERAPVHMPAACDWVAPILATHGLPQWMLAVAWRESRCLAAVHNGDRTTGDNSYGLFQINTLGTLWGEVSRRCNVTQRDELLDADTNVRCARALYAAYGYQPWDSGRYMQQ